MPEEPEEPEEPENVDFTILNWAGNQKMDSV